MIEEGYTKYEVNWTDREAVDRPEIDELERWRRPLFEAKLVGHDPALGIGYGNISVRTGPREFLISGTQTGHLPRTGAAHYALVTDYDIDGNSVTCRGAVQASSEALTHAALYELDPSIGAVVHVHDYALWRRLLQTEPATHEDAAYGTPAMAREFGRLYRQTRFGERCVAAMAGHDAGIVAIGATLGQAAERVLGAQRRPDAGVGAGDG